MKRFGGAVCVFLGLFLFLCLPSAQSGEATIPLGADALTGAAAADCPYKLHLRLAAVALYRVDGDRNERLFYAEHDGNEAQIKSRDIQARWAAGIDTSIMLQNKNIGVELRYLGTPKGWTADRRHRQFGAVGVDDALAKARYDSWLNSGELNFHWWPCPDQRYSLLAGFRWIKVHERIKAFEQEVDGAGTDIFWDQDTASTRNQLWGLQVGAEGLLFGQRDQGFSIDGGVKVGWFHNNINEAWEDWWFEDGDPAPSHSLDRYHRSKNAAVGELGINANYAFTPNIAITCGYQLLYISHASYVAQDFDTQSLIFNGGRVGFNVVF